jgi:uncharacterized protein HemY
MPFVGLKDLCTPAYVYLVISGIALAVMLLQNLGNVNLYCLGSYSCEVSNTSMLFVIKLLYVLFWTWLLNIICRGGATNFAWALVLFPILLMFLMLAMMMIS